MSSFMTMHLEPPLATDAPYPLFNRVSLETSSRCNRRCGFCPVSTGRRDFSASYMGDVLFHNVVGQLRVADAGEPFSGVLQLFLLNEPLNDPNLLRYASVIRAMLPRVTVYVSTNGDAIAAVYRRDRQRGIAKLEELYDAGVNTVNLNVYDSGEKQLDLYHEIATSGVATWTDHKYQRGNSGRARRITVSDMRVDRPGGLATDMFYDRTKEDRSAAKRVDQWCMRPYRHLVIDWRGIVPICCALDPTDPEVIVAGDLNRQTIEEVWQGDVFRKYRYYLQQKRRVLPGCDTCSHRMSYAHAFRHVQATEEERERWTSETGVEADLR